MHTMKNDLRECDVQAIHSVWFNIITTTHVIYTPNILNGFISDDNQLILQISENVIHAKILELMAGKRKLSTIHRFGGWLSATVFLNYNVILTPSSWVLRILFLTMRYSFRP